MLGAVAGATEQIELELCLVEAGACAEAIVQALVAAAERGVRVRCLFNHRQPRVHAASAPAPDPRPGWSCVYNRLSWRRWVGNFYRDHRKFLLVDRCLAVVGGAGVTDEFWTPAMMS